MSTEYWTWRHDGLTDPGGAEAAAVLEHVIHFAHGQILTEVTRDDMQLVIKATTSGGEVFTVAQTGFSVNRLSAVCGTRRYTLNRTRRLRRERAIIDTAGNVVARTRPHGSTLEVFDHPQDMPIPDVDFVFLTWCCMEVDNSGHIRRM